MEILIDRWGVPHVYAMSQDDLFIAQGFNAARDRLFQIDLWRRRGLGLLSEVFGPAYVQRDRAARLFLYRGDMRAEWLAYGSDTKRVTTAFVRGVNAFVSLCRSDPSYLPPEFTALGYLPAFWEPSDVARIRSHGLFYNLEEEVARALTLRDHGPSVEALRREPFGPLRVPAGLDLSVIPDDVLDVYRLAMMPFPGDTPRSGVDGSNNWVIGPSRTATGRPILANDPHRAVALPSLRYIAHLSAPGIDVIGAGEPALPGISIGHNGHVAFGLTIFPIDQEDLYVYRTNPADRREYRYKGRWEPMTQVTSTIPVRGGPPVEVALWFTRHGPVIGSSAPGDAAFAVRAGWLEPGMAPYLGSMDYMRAKSPDEFVAAMNRWGAPGENQVYAAPDGTIGWRPAGLMPRRPNWDGSLPVPGDGRYEWDGFHDVDELPSSRDPSSGWLATANEMNLPADYPHVVTYDWYAPYRHDRIAAELSSRTGWTVEDCVRLQCDYVSEPARRVLPLLSGLSSDDVKVSAALHLLLSWDGDLSRTSPAAPLFEIWFRRHLRPEILHAALSQVSATAALPAILPADDLASDPRVDLDLLLTPGDRLGPDPSAVIEKAILSSLSGAVREVESLLGPDMSSWQWGALHKSLLTHPLAGLVEAPWTTVGPVPRGGSGDTVGSTAYTPNFHQTVGATFRLVVDVGSWDDSVAMNTPGQSGVPDSPHYQDLLEPWAADSSFPLLYSRSLIEQNLSERIELRPPESGAEGVRDEFGDGVRVDVLAGQVLEALLVEQHRGERRRRDLQPCRVALGAGEGQFQGVAGPADDLGVDAAEAFACRTVRVGLAVQDPAHRRGRPQGEPAGQPRQRAGRVAGDRLHVVFGQDLDEGALVDQGGQHVHLLRKIMEHQSLGNLRPLGYTGSGRAVVARFGEQFFGRVENARPRVRRDLFHASSTSFVKGNGTAPERVRARGRPGASIMSPSKHSVPGSHPTRRR